VRAHHVPTDAELGGRSPAEHEEIARAIATDPKGEATVHLDFEDGTLDGWSTRRLVGPWSARADTSRARTGRFSCRFELRPQDTVSQGNRAELRDWWNAPPGSECWYGFSTFLPVDFAPPPDTSIVLAQWHDQARLGEPSGKPPIALRYRGGVLRFTGAAGVVASPTPEIVHLFGETAATAGTWMDFILRVQWPSGGDGAVECFVNGESLFRFNGPLGYCNQTLGPYFKLGLYASGPFTDPLIAWHDNYSRGGTYAAVDPSIHHTERESA
jgi:peptide/nickel transport system ATP-binding protein